jgi:hypothetical protein
VSQVNNSKDWNVALFNLDEIPKEISIDFAAIGIKQKVKVRDLWKKQEAGVFKKEFKQIINQHGAAIFRLTPM